MKVSLDGRDPYFDNYPDSFIRPKAQNSPEALQIWSLGPKALEDGSLEP